MNKRNYIRVEGYLGKDPVTGVTKGGIAYATFDVGVNNPRKNPQTGQWESGTTIWMHIVCYDRLAELAGNHLKKGILIHTEGHMRENNSSYTNKNGQNINSQRMDLIAESITIPITYLPKILGIEQPQQAKPNYQQTPNPSYNTQENQAPGNWNRFGTPTNPPQTPTNNPLNNPETPFPPDVPFPPGPMDGMPF